MITIIKGNKKIQFDNSELASIDVVYDGVFIKFDDQTELRFSFSSKHGLSSVLDIVTRCKQNITIDMNQAIIGNLSKVVVIGNQLNSNETPVTTTAENKNFNLTPEDIVKKLTACK